MIHPIPKVRAAFDRAMSLHADRDTAIAAVAQALGLSVEAVREAVEAAAEAAS